MKKSTSASDQQRYSIGMLLLSVLATYLLGSWAIDSGSILVYALSFLAAWYALFYLRESIRSIKHDKSTKARAARSAH